jgi:hypothetical protein
MTNYLLTAQRRSRKMRQIARVAQVLSAIVLTAFITVGGTYLARAQTVTPLLVQIPAIPHAPKTYTVAFARDAFQPLVTKTVSADADRINKAAPQIAAALAQIKFCAALTTEPPEALFMSGQTWITGGLGEAPFGMKIDLITQQEVMFDDGTTIYASDCNNAQMMPGQQTTTADPYNFNPIGTAGQTAVPQGLGAQTQLATPAPSTTDSVIVPGVTPGVDVLSSPTPAPSSGYDSVYGQALPTPEPIYPRGTPPPNQQP